MFIVLLCWLLVLLFGCFWLCVFFLSLFFFRVVSVLVVGLLFLLCCYFVWVFGCFGGGGGGVVSFIFYFFLFGVCGEIYVFFKGGGCMYILCRGNGRVLLGFFLLLSHEGRKDVFYLTTPSTHIYLRFYGVGRKL